MKYMIAIFGFSAALALVSGAITPIIPATTYIRAPGYDSAVIQSDRFGGNFAYSTVEGQAYQTITPVISNVVRPLAVQYQYNTVPLTAAYPATSLYVQQPILSSYPTYAIAGEAQIPTDGASNAGSTEQQREQENKESITIEAAH